MKAAYALPFVLLAACATLSEEECRAGNWYDIGLHDGKAGRTTDYLTKHTKACAKHGIAPNQNQWEDGRQDGLPFYCRPVRAWQEGAKGRSLSPVCPVAGLDRLEQANWRGRTYYRIGQDIAEAEREIGSINRALTSLPIDDPSRASLINQRTFLRLEIVTLRAERALYRNRY